MVINISVQYNGGFFPDIILLTQGYYHWGTWLNTMMCSGFVFIAHVIVYYYKGSGRGGLGASRPTWRVRGGVCV